MLRGWSELNVPSVLGAPLLGALLITGFGLSESHAGNVEAKEFAADMRGVALAVRNAEFPTVAHIFEDGTIEIQGPLGAFQGAWAGEGETMCVFFDYGPKTGRTCTTIHRSSDGGFMLSDGSKLEPVASALRF